MDSGGRGKAQRLRLTIHRGAYAPACLLPGRGSGGAGIFPNCCLCVRAIMMRMMITMMSTGDFASRVR
jgi:hypothetical protein